VYLVCILELPHPWLFNFGRYNEFMNKMKLYDSDHSRTSWFVCLFIAAWAIFQLSGSCHYYRGQGCKFRPMLSTHGFSSESAFFVPHLLQPRFIRSYPKDRCNEVFWTGLKIDPRCIFQRWILNLGYFFSVENWDRESLYPRPTVGFEPGTQWAAEMNFLHTLILYP
jgi:hypothetical protein